MTLKERVDQHDKQIAAIRNLVHTGMKMMVQMQKEHRKEMQELRAAQRKTDASLQAFIDSMRRGGNGHGKTKLEM